MLALSRNYNAAYLARIGQPGTNGCMVARNGAPLSRSVMAVVVGLPSMTVSRFLSVPAWRLFPDFWNAQNTFSLDPGATARLAGKVYANGDGSSPLQFASSALAATGESAVWGFTESQPYGDFYWNAKAVLNFGIVKILYPWWGGAAPATNPGDGYAATGGQWAMRYRADFSVLATTVPESASFGVRAFSASASGWFYSNAAFHRIGAAARQFAHGGTPASAQDRWPIQPQTTEEEAFAAWYDGGCAACASVLDDFLASARPYLQVVDAGDWTPQQ